MGSKEKHKIICASYLLLVKDGKVLLLRRANTGYEDGNYSVPAGHVEEGESVQDCLIRESKEEIGIDVKKENVEFKHVMHRKGTSTNDERLDFFFQCNKWDGEITNMEPHKCDDLSWHDINNLPDNTIDYIKRAITKSLVDNIQYIDLGW